MPHTLKIKLISLLTLLSLLLLFPANSFSKEAIGHITANVVSPNNMAILDFDDGVICTNDTCQTVRKEKPKPMICNTGEQNRIGKCFDVFPSERAQSERSYKFSSR